MTQISTQLIHHSYLPPAGFDAITVAVHKASTVIFPNVAALRDRDWRHSTGYTYGLQGTPTTFTLEQRMATLDGGRFCVLVPSGLAAIALVDMAFLKSGDEVLIPDNAYGPNKIFAQNELTGWGVTHQFYDSMNAADLAAKVNLKTRLVWVEAAGSITLEFPDLPALVAAVRSKNKNALIAIDNTWGAGVAFKPFDFGVDLSIHAMTKYPSGGGDVLMGSVVTNHEDLRDQLLLCQMRLGYGVGANDAEAGKGGGVRVLPHEGHRDNRPKCSEHEYFGVGKVNKTEYAVHQCVSEGYQGVHRPEGNAVNGVLPESVDEVLEVEYCSEHGWWGRFAERRMGQGGLLTEKYVYVVTRWRIQIEVGTEATNRPVPTPSL